MKRYTQSHSIDGFTMDQLHAIAPSIFAEQPAGKVSERYGFVPTVSVVEELRDRGLRPVFAGQTISRDADNRPFAKHLIRFRPTYAPTIAEQSLPEVVLMNSHDGTSGFKLWMGIFRMVCCNGIIVSDSVMGQVSVPHRSNAAQIVGDRSVDFLGRVDHIEDRIRRFMDRVLTPLEQGQLAETAAQLRWGSNRPAGLNNGALLQARRYEDAGASLWLTLNRIQENIVQGGISLGRQQRRWSSTRALGSVSENARINSQLWEAADKLVAA